MGRCGLMNVTIRRSAENCSSNVLPERQNMLKLNHSLEFPPPPCFRRQVWAIPKIDSAGTISP